MVIIVPSINRTVRIKKIHMTNINNCVSVRTLIFQLCLSIAFVLRFYSFATALTL